jgi:hypothetical protein
MLPNTSGCSGLATGGAGAALTLVPRRFGAIRVGNFEGEATSADASATDGGLTFSEDCVGSVVCDADRFARRLYRSPLGDGGRCRSLYTPRFLTAFDRGTDDGDEGADGTGVVDVALLSTIDANGAFGIALTVGGLGNGGFATSASIRSSSMTVEASETDVSGSGMSSRAAASCACCVATTSICISSGRLSADGASSVRTSISSSAESAVSSLVSGSAMACRDLAPGVLRGCPGTGP